MRVTPNRIEMAARMPVITILRTDKIGFYTPLIDALHRDAGWIGEKLTERTLLRPAISTALMQKLQEKNISTPEALQIWRAVSANVWMDAFGIMQ